MTLLNFKFLNLFLSSHLDSKSCKNFKQSSTTLKNSKNNLSDKERLYNTLMLIYLSVLNKSSLTSTSSLLEGLDYLLTPLTMDLSFINQVSRPTVGTMVSSLADLLIQQGIRQKSKSCRYGIIQGGPG